jgi:hypothetical protein
MSGSNQFSGISTPITPIGWGTSPVQVGAKGAPFSINWVNVRNNIFEFNLTQYEFTNQLGYPQALFIDNSTCPYPVACLVSGLNQNINIPAFSQATVPLFMGSNSTLKFSIGQAPTYPNVTTRVVILNTACEFAIAPSTPLAYQWQTTTQQTLTSAGKVFVSVSPVTFTTPLSNANIASGTFYLGALDITIQVYGLAASPLFGNVVLYDGTTAVMSRQIAFPNDYTGLIPQSWTVSFPQPYTSSVAGNRFLLGCSTIPSGVSVFASVNLLLTSVLIA